MSIPSLEVVRFLEPLPYQEMFKRQQERRAAVAAGEAPNTLYLLQHRPVISLGRAAQPRHVLLEREALLARGIDWVECDRGGDVTYHGPGQLVGYPILDLGQWQRSVGWYLRSLETVVIRFLKGYGLHGERVTGYTGVWVDGAKVAAIGIGVHQWVSFHGVAINIDPDMTHFSLIVPCGIADKPVTSMQWLLGETPPMEEAMGRFEKAFREIFL
jgi:lipoate-protein ligase B